jgi:hypothetical protein
MDEGQNNRSSAASANQFVQRLMKFLRRSLRRRSRPEAGNRGGMAMITPAGGLVTGLPPVLWPAMPLRGPARSSWTSADAGFLIAAAGVRPVPGYPERQSDWSSVTIRWPRWIWMTPAVEERHSLDAGLSTPCCCTAT